MVRSPTFNVAVRWGSWCPFNKQHEVENVICLQGGPLINPEQSFIFKQLATDTDVTGSQGSISSSSVISFHFHEDDQYSGRSSSLQVPGVIESNRIGMPRSGYQDTNSIHSDESGLQEVSTKPPLHPSSFRFIILHAHSLTFFFFKVTKFPYFLS